MGRLFFENKLFIFGRCLLKIFMFVYFFRSMRNVDAIMSLLVVAPKVTKDLRIRHHARAKSGVIINFAL